MALNIDSMNSVEDIENIIPSPINNNPKELFLEGESKLGKVEKEIEGFGDISGINKENNEIMNDNSLIAINKNFSKNVLPKNKIMKNLEIKIKNFFENSKINELSSSTKNNNNYKIKNKNNIFKDNKYNKYENKNIKMNNEKKYNLLFEENKNLDINTLREEYSKIKNDYKFDYNKAKNENKQKKFVSIFGEHLEKKNYETINLNFDEFKIKNKKKRYNYSYNKIDYNFKNFYKTNNNSKEKKNSENDKFKQFSNEYINENNPINYYNNNTNKNKKTFKKNTIFNSLRKDNKSINVYNENDSWFINSNDSNEKNDYNFIQIKKNNKYNSNNNLNIKKNYKTSSIFEKLKLNKNNSNNKNLKLISPKSNFIDFKKINNKNKNGNKFSLINKYNNIKNYNYYYNLTNEEKNNSLNSIKKTKISLNKIMENNDNILDKFTNNFDAIFNFVENKIKGKNDISNFNQFNSRYLTKLNNHKIYPKLLSISQNEPKRNHLMKLFKENNNKISFKNNINFKFSSSIKLNFGINNEKNHFKRLIKKNTHSINFNPSNFSYNEPDFFKSQNKTKKLLNLL